MNESQLHMDSIEQMIQRLCPDGVEYRKLGEIGKFYGGLSGKTKADFVDGNAKFITYMNVYKNPALQQDGEERVRIAEGERQNTVKYTDVLFTGSSETPEECGMSSVVTKETEEPMYLNSFCFGLRLYDVTLFDAGFLKHLFRSPSIRKQIVRTANGVTRFNVSKKLMEDVEIPVPPLEVQRRVAEVLDKFTELEAELEAELGCRRRQYSYYRDKLLSFNEMGGGTQSVTWKKMSEVFEMRNGYTPSKSNKEFWEDGTIPWFRMEDIRQNGRILSDSIQHITEKGVKGKGLFAPNSFILATTATIGEHAWLIAGSLANQQFTNLKIRKSLETMLLPAFVFHYLFIIDEWCKGHTNISGFASVDMAKLKELEFPIPPLAEQERIVSILDRFEALTTDLQEGLPAEIAARRKQYEHYRDRLLTFKRKTA